MDGPASGAINMATDEAVIGALVSDPLRAPTLRIYSWSEPTISVGYHQNAAPVNSRGLPVVRRITGGRAVLHHMEITYSIAAPVAMPVFSGGINGAYSKISRCIVAALRAAGVHAEFARGKTRSGVRSGGRDPVDPACFHAPSRYEVMAGGRKLVGSSQRRFKEAFLQHGSIILEIDRPLTLSVFGPAVVEKMACVRSYSARGADEITGALIEGFAEGLGAGFTTAGLDDRERMERDAMLTGKFLDPHWCFPL